MSLTLHYHPLASFCWKALIALYENDVAFAPRIVDLMDPAGRAAFNALNPLGKMPVLEDSSRGEIVPESTIVIEYLERHYPGRAELVPVDGEAAWRIRLLDRFFDLYVHEPMQKIVIDKLRPQGRSDSFGVEQARANLAVAYAEAERRLAGKTWAAGESFSLADCSAAPALFYADKVAPLGSAHPQTAAYLERLKARPSFARVLKEAEPYFVNFPG
jgi:glutathione S-transferase